MENQNVTAVMALDLSAAFDTVNHKILLGVLEHNFGLEHTVLNRVQLIPKSQELQSNIRKEYSSSPNLPFSIPQGSCAGVQLFNVYCSSIQDIVGPPLTLHGFADDHRVGNKFKPGDWGDEARCMDELEKCVTDLKVWMNENRLKMNNNKTEFIIFGSKPQLDKCKTKTLNFNDTEIEHGDKIKYLGVLLDQKLTLKQHITSKCQTAMLNIQQIKNIRHLLTQEATEILVLGTIMSHLDYCNSVLVGLPDVDIFKMQHIQNTAARMVVLNDVAMRDSNSRCILANLHWLPICRIEYKILTLVHKCLSSGIPKYLNNLLTEYPYAERRQGLRSQHQERRLVELKAKLKTFAARSFSCAGPKWWNRLPNTLKTIKDTQQFKIRLKTYLFKEEYNC